MIYVTADLHGDVDRLRSLPVKLGRKDTLIVLGDFGFLWDGSKAEKKMLKWLGKRRYQLLFLDGAHENYDLLDSYEVTDFAGGRAQQISGKLYHLMRGEVYTIEEKKLLCFGGGESPDGNRGILPIPSQADAEDFHPQRKPGKPAGRRGIQPIRQIPEQ